MCEGDHIIRRGNLLWAGLSPDCLIEQELMKSVKSIGGLTCLTGIIEQKHLLWLLGLPASAEMNLTKQSFSRLTICTSEQNQQQGEKEPSRQARDCKDTDTIIQYLQTRNHSPVE